MANEPGYYESDLADYPGYIQFPAPMMLPHFKIWWERAVTALKGLTRADYAFVTAEWNAAKALLLDYDGWHIEGVLIGDVKGDSVPLEVMSFVEDCADDYIFPQLSEKKRRWLSTAT